MTEPQTCTDERGVEHLVRAVACAECGCPVWVADDNVELIWESGEYRAPVCKNGTCGCHLDPANGEFDDESSVEGDGPDARTYQRSQLRNRMVGVALLAGIVGVGVGYAVTREPQREVLVPHAGCDLDGPFVAGDLGRLVLTAEDLPSGIPETEFMDVAPGPQASPHFMLRLFPEDTTLEPAWEAAGFEAGYQRVFNDSDEGEEGTVESSIALFSSREGAAEAFEALRESTTSLAEKDLDTWVAADDPGFGSRSAAIEFAPDSEIGLEGEGGMWIWQVENVVVRVFAYFHDSIPGTTQDVLEVAVSKMCREPGG